MFLRSLRISEKSSKKTFQIARHQSIATSTKINKEIKKRITDTFSIDIIFI